MLVISILTSILTALIALISSRDPAVIFAYLFVVPLILSVPHIMFHKNKTVNSLATPQWLVTVQIFSFLILILNAPGSLILHSLGLQYDRFLHFSVAALFLPMIFIFSLPWYYKNFAKKMTITRWINSFAIWSFIGLFLFEGYQFSVDYFLGTHLFFDVKQPIKIDFIEDIIFGSTGLLLSLYFLHKPPRFIEQLINQNFKNPTE